MSTTSRTSRIKYGLSWEAEDTDLEIELWMVKQGNALLKEQGRNLFQHFKAAMTLLWPSDDHHRWTDLILQSYCENEISVFIGCSDSCKTHTMSKIALIDYWASPTQTLSLVSTTEGRGAELRIWGNIKTLFNQARERHDWLEGQPIDYLKTITTDSIDEEGREARSLRAGLIVIPCKVGGTVSGLAPFIGIKAARLRHTGDEVQCMSESFLSAYSNWYGKTDFRGMMAGNFMETDDPLGIASEPEDGWDAWVDSGKTQEWKSRFFGAHVVALDGRDSPNDDGPPNPSGKPRYGYLISEKKRKAVLETYGEDSWQWWSQCVGKPAKGMDIWRVLNRDFCNRHGASEEVIWKDDTLMGLYALDPAYGGGDLCVGRYLQMGMDLRGKQTLFFHPPEVIPIKANTGIDPEEQIATYIHNRLATLNIPSPNCFYDSFGRGTLGHAFAKLFGATCPVPVDSGSQCTTRPVRFDLFVNDKDGNKRLKRCDEHYKKFITEMYFSVREAIESDQVRGLDSESIREGAARKFTKNSDTRLEIEPKDEYKERHQGRSPDRMDNAAIAVEGARQRGFKIERLGTALIKKSGPDWLDTQSKEYKEFLDKRQLANV